MKTLLQSVCGIAIVAILVLIVQSCKSGVTKPYNDEYVMLRVDKYETGGDLLSPLRGWTKNKNWQDPDVIIGGIVELGKVKVIKSEDGTTFVSSRKPEGEPKASNLVADYSCYIVDDVMSEYVLSKTLASVTDVQNITLGANSRDLVDRNGGKFVIFAAKHSDYKRISRRSIRGISDDAMLRFDINVNNIPGER